jgi:hypothetical protein
MPHPNLYSAQNMIRAIAWWKEMKRANVLRFISSAGDRTTPPAAAQESEAWSILPVIPSRDLVLGGPCIGRGTYKTVHRGEWRSKAVAVATVGRGASSLESELCVIRIVGPHPHVIEVHGVCEVEDDPDNLHIVSELAPLGSLGDVMSRAEERGEFNRISSPVILAVAMQICEAMAHVTSAGIVHRDLGARNVLVFKFNPNTYFDVYVKVRSYVAARMTI